MEAIMAVMIILMVVAWTGSGHLPMMGGHGKVGQTEGSEPPAAGEENCQQCPQQEQLKKGYETPAN